jgi:hypothetical protein
LGCHGRGSYEQTALGLCSCRSASDHGVAETFAKAAGVDAATIRETAASTIATGRFSTPEEVTMLASERMANVTGVNYVIDGGLIKTT